MRTSDRTAADEAQDPVEVYADALSAALRGPARLKTQVLQEVVDGLTDAADAYTSSGLEPPAAAARAVRDFGAPSELVPAWQRELTAAQTRATARTLAAGVPLIIVLWQLIWWLCPVPVTTPSHGPQMLAVHLAGVSSLLAVAALIGSGLAGKLGRWLPAPRRLPALVSGATATAAACMAAGVVAATAASPAQLGWPLLLGTALTAIAVAAMARAALACRRCTKVSIPAAKSVRRQPNTGHSL